MSRTFTGRVLVAGLCLAAATAIVALLTGGFDDTHARVILTSLGFSLFGATAGTGDALRTHGGAPPGARAAGALTIAASVAAFLLLVTGLWVDDEETIWRAFTIAGLLSLLGSHVSAVLRARHPGDTPAIEALVVASIAIATFNTAVGIGAALGVEDAPDWFLRIVAASFVLLALTTILPPLLRRLADIAPAEDDASGGVETLSRAELAHRIEDAADRLDALDGSPQVRREAAALRELAARAGRR